ncbi:MAG TPA: thioredoxin domain-containing protein [Xanthomonadales bacterium]|nr:thioredoxin domain-containing protein [Xanthomonadales bacterium]
MSTPTPKKSDYVEIKVPKFSFKDTPTNAFLVLTLVIFAFLLGMLTNKVIYLENATKAAELQAVPSPAAEAPPVEDNNPKQVSVDDDPVMGDKNAKVTLIEFSDYECPYCKRYFDATYEQVKKAYVDTGKIKYVYRDLPLSFHDPLATLEAVAANCAREQGDDSTYFRYHDELFKRTTSNGNGLTEDDMNTIASDLGLNLSQFQTCLADEKNKEEVKKDVADANAAGATGTPSFFIGKSTQNGIISGTPLIGAQPFRAFQTLIEEELKK